MKCHYEILELSLSASDDDIRKSYRKLALKWHPDKNLANPEEAKDQFQLIQQAYEVLSDPQERAWYDKHRDSILRGGLGTKFKDDCINIYEYFTTSCFNGFEDDPKGFYSVYGEVFNKIASEESEYDDDLDSDSEIPSFGNSCSSYDEVVHAFYSYWQSFSTKKTFSWLDVYDTRQAPNRKILRLMEKENKKVRDRARKERNEEVRALVAFVRKRDKRVIKHINHLEEMALEKERKNLEIRRQQIVKRQKEISSYKESEWSKFSNLKTELEEIEKTLAAEFDDLDSEDSSLDDIGAYENLYCVACNKVFKTDKAFFNHEKSKKHRENIELIRAEMKAEETNLINLHNKHYCKGSESSYEEDLSSEEQQELKGKKASSELHDSEEIYTTEDRPANSKKKKTSKKSYINKGQNFLSHNFAYDNHSLLQEEVNISVFNNSDLIEQDSFTNLLYLENNQGKRRNRNNNDEMKDNKIKRKNKKKDSKTKEKSINEENDSAINAVDSNKGINELECGTCKIKLKSKNSLFKHLRESGHATPTAGEQVIDNVNSNGRKAKKQKKLSIN